MEGTYITSPPALLRAVPRDAPEFVPTGPRLVRRRTALIAIAAITPLALAIGASTANLGAREPPTTVRRAVVPTTLTVPETLGKCASDYTNLFATIAPMRGEIAAQVVAQLPPEYADAMGSLSSSVSSPPPPPDAPTLAHVLARLSDSSGRRAVLSELPPTMQAAVKDALLDTALVYMTYRVPPACP